ncbi:MAG TPA: serine/threonine-protein kinase, partial [Planctomycetota bacterium]|nr:serine/threonine-protein kinase [Planctomycetota bacterium]
PGNILVDRDGEPWLLDFGLVRDLADDRTFCDGRTVLGTAQYMSPEQVKGLRRQTDQRSDVYSLGVTLYELLTLTRPFDDRDTTAILHAVVEEEPPSPRSVVRDLPVDLETVVLKAMAKRPEHRYASAGEMAADLKRLRLRQPILAHRPGFARWRRKLKGAQTTVAAGLLLAFASVTGLAGVTVWRNGRDDLARREALMAADTAFHAGEYEKAVEEYRVFLRLGGREEDVGARLQEARRLADGPEGR